MKFSAKCRVLCLKLKRQRAASEGQRGGRRGQEGLPSPLYRASWSTVKTGPLFVLRFYSPVFCQELSSGANGPIGPKKKKNGAESQEGFLFVLRFYGPGNPMGSCRERSVCLTTRLLGRLSPLSG